MKYLSWGQQKILAGLALFILALLYFKFYFRPSLPPDETYPEVVLEIVGEVQKPGIHIFKNPPTLIEAVQKAGGLKESVLFERHPCSEVVETGTLLTVTRKSSKEIKITSARMDARKLLTFSIPLDLNRVSVEDLCLIPGIRPPLAREIVTYRERRRGFLSVEELKNVKGIEEKKYQSLKALLTVRP
ncbi:MAG: helix-hairpin-helix domain-containing protein [Thermodesulfobacteriota bacterium]